MLAAAVAFGVARGFLRQYDGSHPGIVIVRIEGAAVGADYSKVHRLLRMVTLMQSGEAGDAKQLAELLGVTVRTIYRDLEILAELGIPCYFDESIGAYRIRKDFFLPPVQLTATEALSMLALSQCVGGEEQIALTEPAARAMEKLRGQLPASIRDELSDLGSRIDIRLPATGPDGAAIRDVYAHVREAIRTRRAVRCRYESLNNDTDDNEFHLLPYTLIFDQRAWYTIGLHEGRGEVRRLKLTRFAAVTFTDRPYGIPDDFSLDTFRGKAWRMIRGDRLHRVVIDFDATVADTVSETNWHPTQQEPELHDDGSLTFRCEVEGLDEIVWWVLGYGPHATVREPVELANKVAELAKTTAERYARR